MKIFEAYVLKQFLRVFIFLLLSLFFLYVLMDYATHTQDFILGSGASIKLIAHYYLLQFVKRAEILVPLALLLSTIKVLTHLNAHRELVAFQAAGIHKGKLIRPILLVASLCTLLSMGINEYGLSYSLNQIDKFYDKYLSHSYKGNRGDPLHVMVLEDQSKLVYQFYDAAKESFFDVLWIRSSDEIWKMKYLKADPEFPHGQFVDHLLRNREGVFEKSQSFPLFFFEDLKWDQGMPKKGFVPFENRSVSELLIEEKRHHRPDSYRSSEITTQIFFKLAMPLLSLLVVMGVAPYCVRHVTRLAQLSIYGIALFSFVGFIAFMDAAVILGESSTFPPSLVILTPFALALGFFGWKIVRLQ